MLPTSFAFTWLLWRWKRWVILDNIIYLLVACLASAYCKEGFWAEAMVGIAVIGLCRQFIYLLAAFTYSLDGTDLVARNSLFPPSLFRLPVRTGPLVVWPLAVGAAVIGLVWLVSAVFILRPCVAIVDGSTVPLWWPVVFAVAGLAWF